MFAPDWVPGSLRRTAVRRSLGAGETPFLREDRLLGNFLLESGEIRLVGPDPEGREMTHFRAHPGETFAEASLFSVSWGWAAPHGFKPNGSGGKEARRCDPPCKGGREPTPEPAYGSVREQCTHEQARITFLAMALHRPRRHTPSRAERA